MIKSCNCQVNAEADSFVTENQKSIDEKFVTK